MNEEVILKSIGTLCPNQVINAMERKLLVTEVDILAKFLSLFFSLKFLYK